MSQSSVEFDGVSITRTPIDFFAIHLEIASEMNEPPKPITAAKISSEPRFSPFAVRYGSTPRMRMVNDSTSTIARLVARNKTIRFMMFSFNPQPVRLGLLHDSRAENTEG